MEPVEGLGDHIQLDKRILENNFLKHAFAAHLELENTHRLPKFEYQAEVLYTAIFSFIGARFFSFWYGTGLYGKRLNALSMIESFYAIDDGIESPLSKERVRELEAVIDVGFPASKKAKEALLLNKQNFAHHALTLPEMYIRLSKFRRHIDHLLWEAVCKKEFELTDEESAWPKEHLSPSKVPTVEEILYWILRDEFFASKVTYWLVFIESNGDYHRNRPETQRLSDTIFFFCAIILIDEVAKKAEKFMLTDDIQHCLKRFPRVYIQ